MTELIWDGKYKDGKKQGPVRIALPFQTIETVNESAQERQRSLELFSAGREAEWRNRLIWGDKKYVLSSLLPEFTGQVDLIYVDPPFDTGADFSYMATVPHHQDQKRTQIDKFCHYFAKAPRKADGIPGIPFHNGTTDSHFGDLRAAAFPSNSIGNKKEGSPGNSSPKSGPELRNLFRRALCRLVLY